jgi:hypothetical protein
VGSQLTKDKAASFATPVASPAKPATPEPAKQAPLKASPPAAGVVSTPVRVSASSSAAAVSVPAPLSASKMPVTVPSATAAPVKSGRAAAVPVETPSLARLRADDARAAWQARPSIPVRLLDNYINFMVMGE